MEVLLSQVCIGKFEAHCTCKLSVMWSFCQPCIFETSGPSLNMVVYIYTCSIIQVINCYLRLQYLPMMFCISRPSAC